MPRRGENIYKRKDGRWEARYVKEIEPDGKKKYGSVYADNYKDVKAKQQQCLLHPPKNSRNSIHFTVSALMAEWLESIKNQVKPNTYQKYESVCKNHIVNALGAVLVELISNYTIINFTNHLKEKKLSTKSINDALIVLGLAFKYAAEEYKIATPRIRYLKEEKKDMRVLSMDEQRQLTTYLNGNIDIHKFGILLALYTGIRVGELCALQWEDITDAYIKIEKTMTRVKADNGKTEIKIGPPKSDSSKRLMKYYYTYNDFRAKAKENFGLFGVPFLREIHEAVIDDYVSFLETEKENPIGEYDEEIKYIKYNIVKLRELQNNIKKEFALQEEM